MKKIIVLLLLLVLPVTVFAAEAPKVTKLELKNDKQVITYTGEMEDGSLAVMCKLYNSNNEELDYLSTAVDTNKFEGKFTVSKNDTYKVSCANYEGGEIKSETIKVANANPKTGDEVEIYCIVFAVSVAAVVIALMYPKYLKKNRKSTAPAVKRSTTKKTTTPKKTTTTKKAATKKTTAKKTTKKK